MEDDYVRLYKSYHISSKCVPETKVIMVQIVNRAVYLYGAYCSLSFVRFVAEYDDSLKTTALFEQFHWPLFIQNSTILYWPLSILSHMVLHLLYLFILGVIVHNICEKHNIASLSIAVCWQ